MANISFKLNIRRRNYNFIVLFLIGAIILSRFSSFLILNILKLGIYVPEILIIPFFYFIIKKYGKFLARFFKKNVLNFTLVILLFIILILQSLVYNQYGIRYILATARGYVYIVFFAMIGKNLKYLVLNEIFALSIGSVVISFIWLFFFASDFSNISDVYYASLNCIFLAIIIPLLRKKYLSASIIITMVVYIGIFSGLRRILFVLLIALIMGLIIDFIKNKPIKRLIPLSIIVTLFLSKNFIISQILKLTSQNELLRNRIVLKTLNTIIGTGDPGDLGRLKHIGNLFNYAQNNIIPHGFLTKNTFLTNDGLFMDLPLYELFHTFGSIITLLFVTICIFIIIKRIKNVKNNEQLYYIIPLTNIMFMMYLFFDGGFLIWQYNTVFTGLFLGILFNKNIKVYYE